MLHRHRMSSGVIFSMDFGALLLPMSAMDDKLFDLLSDFVISITLLLHA